MSDVLPKAFDDAHFAFYGGDIQGTPQQNAKSELQLDARQRCAYTRMNASPESKMLAGILPRWLERRWIVENRSVAISGA